MGGGLTSKRLEPNSETQLEMVMIMAIGGGFEISTSRANHLESE